MANSKLRIVVLGYIVRGPLGGLVWHHLQYVLGLVALGHEVFYLEDSDDYPSCYDPTRHVTDENSSYGLQFAAATFGRFGLADRWGYYDAHRKNWHGPLGQHAAEICAEANLLINLSGVNPLRAWLQDIPVRVFVDTDPAFTQIRHIQDPQARRRAHQHTVFFTFGENIPTRRCELPDDQLPWRATRQPICLQRWPIAPATPRGKYTTVMQWDSYPALNHAGRRYGMKSDSFAAFVDLPKRAAVELELALGSPNAPREELARRGWRLHDPLQVTRDCNTFQKYVQRSKGEFSVAKQGYVISQCGWFSERSAAYMASGRPVVVQDTGFQSWLNVDRGVFPFGSIEEALEGIEQVESQHQSQCRAAREVCEQFFDAEPILTRLIEQALGGG